MTFTTVRLAGHRTLVSGQDSTGNEGQVVLDSSQWDSLKERTRDDDALKAFDSAVEEFFRPLTDAADALTAAKEKAEEADWFVIEEPVEGKAGRPGHRVRLTHDSQILQLLENGQADSRLLWVNNSLEISEDAIPSTSVTSGPTGSVGAGTAGSQE